MQNRRGWLKTSNSLLFTGMHGHFTGARGEHPRQCPIHKNACYSYFGEMAGDTLLFFYFFIFRKSPSQHSESDLQLRYLTVAGFKTKQKKKKKVGNDDGTGRQP